MGGYFFLFSSLRVICITIFMIIVNVKDQTCEIQQNTANFQQVVESDVLIHHSNHLPTVVNSAVGAEAKEFSNRLPFQVCPQIFIIPDTSKFVKQKRTQQHRHIHYIIASSQTVLTYAGRSRCAASFSGAFSHEKCSPKWNARLLHKMRRAFLCFQTKKPGSSWLFLRLMLQ